MPSRDHAELTFSSRSVSAKLIDPAGQLIERPVEIRTSPLTGRTCRIAFSRTEEKEAGTDALPPPPPDAADTSNCPFCRPRVNVQTPRLHPDLGDEGRLARQDSLLFPNLFSGYLDREKKDGSRYIGKTGSWNWVTAFAPEGFFEIWAILPGITSIQQPETSDWQDLVKGIFNIQRFYRSLNRNGYNLGLLSVETSTSHLELRLVIMVRPNYAPWVRSDHTGFEVMLGDMTTFVAPEQTAQWVRPFFGG